MVNESQYFFANQGSSPTGARCPLYSAQLSVPGSTLVQWMFESEAAGRLGAGGKNFGKLKDEVPSAGEDPLSGIQGVRVAADDGR